MWRKNVFLGFYIWNMVEENYVIILMHEINSEILSNLSGGNYFFMKWFKKT